VTHWSIQDRGGHFAALEAPEALAQDLRTFFANYR
jgi:pimeloyl-ACP methyl ester carboxylesterase